jgi:hypothetical protein
VVQNRWLDWSPHDVRLFVIREGGWKQVFQDGVPRWASRVRNYFNVTPQKLTRLGDKLSETLLRHVQKAIVAADCAQIKRIYDQLPGADMGVKYPGVQLPKGCPANPDPNARMSFSDTMGTRHALSGEVYRDDSRRIWYQMDPGASRRGLAPAGNAFPGASHRGPRARTAPSPGFVPGTEDTPSPGLHAGDIMDEEAGARPPRGFAPGTTKTKARPGASHRGREDERPPRGFAPGTR